MEAAEQAAVISVAAEAEAAVVVVAVPLGAEQAAGAVVEQAEALPYADGI